MTETVDVVVIGAGVVGLAVARALALQGRDVIVVEQHDHIGAETSSRNSEVIHAGIYYRPGGLRARLCAPGKALLYEYCRARMIPHERCGKLIVANDGAEVARLGPLKELAEKNGVDDLRQLGTEEALAMEPELRCLAALHSPSSGIVDSHSLMISLLGDIENAGGVLGLNSPVIGGEAREQEIFLAIGGRTPIDFRASLVVNCAGLHADKTALSIKGLDKNHIPAIRPAKGQYFTYSGRPPFSRLVYPLHSPDSQGVHYTRDLGGQARLGPDIRWDAPLGDYSVDETRLDAFVAEARRFWPTLDPLRLQPGYAGQRPKIAGPGEEGDFLILGPKEHGSAGYIGLYGIESPGLTSCLAVADYVAAMAAA